MTFVGDVNSTLDDGDADLLDARDAIVELFGVLGVDVRPNATETESEMADLLLNLRESFRESEDWETSDLIRDRLQTLGFKVEDTDSGAEWFRN
ncbi:MAG: hypothetical protein BRC26_02815 [Nanohaloarchaea archaeon QH_8_44_6]|nr:MAG: hypothetical protein BRC26_02815 [Nanohaloarchaea archaeon QH_8_44_6]